jgi:hypothetical protein
LLSAGGIENQESVTVQGAIASLSLSDPWFDMNGGWYEKYKVIDNKS